VRGAGADWKNDPAHPRAETAQQIVERRGDMLAAVWAHRKRRVDAQLDHERRVLRSRGIRPEPIEPEEMPEWRRSRVMYRWQHRHDTPAERQRLAEEAVRSILAVQDKIDGWNAEIRARSGPSWLDSAPTPAAAPRPSAAPVRAAGTPPKSPSIGDTLLTVAGAATAGRVLADVALGGATVLRELLP
jgi:hypothetical protein